jgi:predicted permease
LANLTLTRLIGREGELATRGALGATPGGLRKSLAIENVVLAIGGATLGLVMALASRGALAAYASRFTVRAEEVSIDASVLLFTLLIGTGVAVIIALLPGLPVAPKPAAGLGYRSIGTAGRRSAQRGLVVLQLSLSFALLAGAGLLVRSLLELQSVDPGFETENILTMQAFRSFASTGSTVDDSTLFEQVLGRVEMFPGVRAAGVAGWAPLTGQNAIAWYFRVEGHEEPRVSTQATVNNVTDGYFRALKPRLLSGRYVSHMDMSGSDSVVVVSQSFARERFPDSEPVGQRVSWSWDAQSWGPWRRIVGVVADARLRGLGRQPVPAVYVPAAQSNYGSTFVIATTGDPGILAREVTEAVRQLDPTRPVDRIRTVEDLMTEDVAPARLNATLYGAFALLALAIAAVGVLGVLAFSVSQRTREFGVRMAIGADPGRLLRTVLGEGARLVLAALVLGGLLAILGARLLSGLLFGVEPLDPASLLAAGFALGSVGLAAAFFPARRATRIDPVEALRAD